MINVLAPFLLTALVERPDRLIYLSSGMHQSGNPDFADLQWKQRRWGTAPRLTPTPSCWTQPLRLSSPDDGRRGIRQRGGARLGGDEDGRGRSARRYGGGPADPGVAGRSDSETADITGGYFYHRRPRRPALLAQDRELHQLLLETCSSLAGVELPA